jgi:hypothetical protein
MFYMPAFVLGMTYAIMLQESPGGTFSSGKRLDCDDGGMGCAVGGDRLD